MEKAIHAKPAASPKALDRSPIDPVLVSLFLAGLVVAVWSLLHGISNREFDVHAFRQSQTALSVYALLNGGHWLAYETPVIGAPWTMPFEFPLYQWIVAILSGSTGLAIEAAGRLTSWVFYLVALLPALHLSQLYSVSTNRFLVFAILYVSAPIYMFWGRTFMIESTALFMCATWLALLASGIRGSRLGWVGAAVLVPFATTVKVTTFLGFGLLAGILVIHAIYRWWREGTITAHLGRVVAAASIAALGTAATISWTIYIDVLKADHPIGSLRLTSTALKEWNFGTIEQRLDPETWSTIFGRSAGDIFGYSLAIVLILLIVGLTSRRHLFWVAVSLLCFVAPLLAFPNLHFIHNYYQAANAVFFIGAAAIALDAVSLVSRKLTLIFTAGIAAGQLLYFLIVFAPQIGTSETAPKFQIARAAAGITSQDDVLVVWGTDWSSEVAYYARRRAITVPAWAPMAYVDALMQNPAAFSGGLPVTATIVCENPTLPDRAKLDAFLQSQTFVETVGNCSLYRIG